MNISGKYEGERRSGRRQIPIKIQPEYPLNVRCDNRTTDPNDVNPILEIYHPLFGSQWVMGGKA